MFSSSVEAYRLHRFPKTTMTREEIIDCYLRNIGDDNFRGSFQVTKMTRDADIARCREEVADAYLVPYLSDYDYIAPEEGSEEVDAIGIAIAGAVARLQFARLIYANLWRSEYATAKPAKQNAVAAERAEIVRQAATSRRLAIATLEDLRRDGGLRAAPKRAITPILGEEL